MDPEWTHDISDEAEKRQIEGHQRGANRKLLFVVHSWPLDAHTQTHIVQVAARAAAEKCYNSGIKLISLKLKSRQRGTARERRQSSESRAKNKKRIAHDIFCQCITIWSRLADPPEMCAPTAAA